MTAAFTGSPLKYAAGTPTGTPHATAGGHGGDVASGVYPGERASVTTVGATGGSAAKTVAVDATAVLRMEAATDNVPTNSDVGVLAPTAPTTNIVVGNDRQAASTRASPSVASHVTPTVVKVKNTDAGVGAPVDPNAVIDYCRSCGQRGPVQLCSACKSVYYCSAKCQGADWKRHKKLCKSIAKSMKAEQSGQQLSFRPFTARLQRDDEDEDEDVSAPGIEAHPAVPSAWEHPVGVASSSAAEVAAIHQVGWGRRC